MTELTTQTLTQTHVRIKDPADFMAFHSSGKCGCRDMDEPSHAAKLFSRMVDHAPNALEYKWKQLIEKHTSDSITDKTAAVTEFMQFLAKVEIESVRKGQIFMRLSTLSGVPIEDLRKLASPRPMVVKPQPAPRMGGKEVGQRWLLGCLLNQPSLYAKFREDIRLEIFPDCQLVAAALIEFWEGHGDLDACTLGELTSTIGDPDLVRQAITMESAIDQMMNPDVSTLTAQAVKSSMSSRGVTVESTARDLIVVLLKAQAKR